MQDFAGQCRTFCCLFAGHWLSKMQDIAGHSTKENEKCRTMQDIFRQCRTFSANLAKDCYLFPPNDTGEKQLPYDDDGKDTILFGFMQTSVTTVLHNYILSKNLRVELSCVRRQFCREISVRDVQKQVYVIRSRQNWRKKEVPKMVKNAGKLKPRKKLSQFRLLPPLDSSDQTNRTKLLF